MTKRKGLLSRRSAPRLSDADPMLGAALRLSRSGKSVPMRRRRLPAFATPWPPTLPWRRRRRRRGEENRGQVTGKGVVVQALRFFFLHVFSLGRASSLSPRSPVDRWYRAYCSFPSGGPRRFRRCLDSQVVQKRVSTPLCSSRRGSRRGSFCSAVFTLPDSFRPAFLPLSVRWGNSPRSTS